MDSPKTVREAIERLGWKPEQDSDAFIREALTELFWMRKELEHWHYRKCFDCRPATEEEIKKAKAKHG